MTSRTAIDSTYIKAQRAAFGEKGAFGPATKIHALADVTGRPFALMLTPGNVSDITAAPARLERASVMRYLLGDKGYEADRLRRALRETGTTPVIPGRCNRKRIIRYDELANNFLSAIAFATALAFWL